VKAKIVLSQAFVVEAKDADMVAYVTRKYVARFPTMAGIDAKAGSWKAEPFDILGIHVEEVADAEGQPGAVVEGRDHGNDRPSETGAPLNKRSNHDRVHAGELSFGGDESGRRDTSANEVKALEIF
jgi:hypothetical protein